MKFRAHDFTFMGLDRFSPHAGERARFTMLNEGPADHEFEVFGPDGKAVDEIEPIGQGRSGSVALTLRRRGTYSYICGVSDHEERGMKGTFTVS